MCTLEEAKAKYSEVTSNKWDFDKFMEELFAGFEEAKEEAYNDGRDDGWEDCIQNHT